MHQYSMCNIFSRHIVGVLLLMLGLTGCGASDDGGTGSSSLTYTGSTTPAVITAANATQLTGAVFGVSNFTGGIAAGALEAPVGDSSRFTISISHVAAAIQRAVALAPVGQLPAAGVVIPPVPIPGNISGTLTISGFIDDITLVGSLTMVFANYSNISGEVMNGTVNALVNDVDLADPLNPVILDILMNFSDFTYTGSTGSFTMQGNIQVVTDVLANSETLTANLLGRDNATGETGRVDNLVVFSIYDNVLSPTSANVIITGRVFEPTEGYVDVDVSIVSPLTFTSLLVNLFPDGGGPVILTGASGSSVRAAPMSGTLVFIDVDVDADGVYETIIGPVQWDSL